MYVKYIIKSTMFAETYTVTYISWLGIVKIC